MSETRSSGVSSDAAESRLAVWTPWAAWLAAWAVGLAFVLPIEIAGWRAGEGGWFERVLVGINIDTSPYLWWLLAGLLLAGLRMRRSGRLMGSGRRGGRLAAWWSTRAGQGGPGVGLAMLLVGAVSLGTSLHTASRPVRGPVAGRPEVQLGSLPPGFHDEYSYLFQAQTFVSGEWNNQGHRDARRLFDQMHVLNDDGVFASRYFPGVGAWMAPFVAWGEPVWGHYLAGVLTAIAVLGIGRELAGNGVGLLAGLMTALAPGMALFSNLLLSHHPTLAGLTMFVYWFLRMQRSGSLACGLLAGMGLSLAMLCRPLTAAAVGLPFGCWLAWWWLRGDGGLEAGGRHIRVICVGLPVLAGLLVMGWYNHQLTGDWLRTPYQVYTDQHTPCHVFGFDNVVRGEHWKAGMDPESRQRVLEHYDDWAENLDAELASGNVVSRLIESGKWTVGLVVLMMTSVVLLVGFLLGSVPLPGTRWWSIVLAIVCVHLAHVPYWYAGIMNWHYVFETAPFWCVLVAGVTVRLWQLVSRVGRPGLAVAWTGLLLVTPMTSYLEFDPVWSPSRIDLAVGEIGYARARHADFRQRLETRIGSDRALVLVDADPSDRHIDLVVNPPQLNSVVLVGRYLPKVVPMSRVLKLFPSRRVFVFDVSRGGMREIRR